MPILELLRIRREMLTRGIGTGGDIYLYVISADSGVAGALDSMLHGSPREIGSIDDLASLVAQLCASGKRIRRLVVRGHGNGSGQYIGRDWLDASSLPRFTRDFERIRKYLTLDCDVILTGCEVGKAVNLMPALSTVLGVRVKAYQDAQLPGGVRQGAESVCVRATCMSTEPTLGERVQDLLE